MSNATHETTRRQLAGRRTDMVDRLLDAAVSEIAKTGYDGLTVRNVARAAGVSPASAYTYFASKEHLLAEVFWRRLTSLPDPVVTKGARTAARVEAAIGPVALLVADEPELAAGVTTALLAHDPDVKRLREQIGLVFSQRLSEALGPKASDDARLGLTMAFTGALLSAGMGLFAYEDLPGMVGRFAALVEGRGRG